MMPTNTLVTKIFGLDVFRAIAILLVLFSHLYFVLDVSSPLAYSLSGLFGFLGVEMFFILSGFLIGRILLKQLLLKKFDFNNLVKFLKRRWLRTLPAYYFVLFLNLLIAYFISYNLDNTWKYVFFLQNLWNYNIGFFTESWSLSIEEWSYLISPFVLFLALYFVKNNTKVLFVTCTVGIIVLAHILRYIKHNLVVFENMETWNENLKLIVIYRIDAVAYGFLLAWLYVYYNKFLQKISVYSFITSLHILFLQFFVFNALGITLVTNPVYFNVFYFTVTAIAIMLLFPFFIFWEVKPIGGSIFEFISKISYSIYLLHYSICAVVFKYTLSYYNINIHFWIKLVLYLAIVFSTSFLLYKYIEKPFLKLRDKFYL